jgi:hypothetical protein
LSWELKFYTTPGGKRPVYEYLEEAGLSEDEEDKLKARLEFLEEHGPLAGQNVPRGYAQLKGEFRDISEIRIPGEHNVRVFYFIDPKRQVVLLSGVSKGGMRDKTMKRHYARALGYRNDWLTRCI